MCLTQSGGTSAVPCTHQSTHRHATLNIQGCCATPAYVCCVCADTIPAPTRTIPGHHRHLKCSVVKCSRVQHSGRQVHCSRHHSGLLSGGSGRGRRDPRRCGRYISSGSQGRGHSVELELVAHAHLVDGGTEERVLPIVVQLDLALEQQRAHTLGLLGELAGA